MNSQTNKLNTGLSLNIDTQSQLFGGTSFSKTTYDASCTLYRGDNDQVLKKLVDFTDNVFDFCYIDPPYNTKNKFIYDDSRVSKNHKIWGSHAQWMEFMASRLISLHKLLKESGIIAISIDDYEQPYLRILLDQIFGEDNFISCFAVCRSKNGKGSKHGVSTNHEYIVVYGRSKKAKLIGFNELDTSTYDKEDRHGRYKVNGLFRKKGDASLREDRPNMHYPLYYNEKGEVFTENTAGSLKEVFPKDSKGVERRWLWGKEKASKESWKLYASKGGVIYVKNYFSGDKKIKPRSLWHDNRHLTERATNQIKKIYGDKVFETPKPLELIEDIIESHTNKNSLIIDFFAGTGTTAHAAYNLNQKDNGNRKVVLIEHEELISPDHISRKYGFNEIADITEYRLKWLSDLDDSFKYKVIETR